MICIAASQCKSHPMEPKLVSSMGMVSDIPHMLFYPLTCVWNIQVIFLTAISDERCTVVIY